MYMIDNAGEELLAVSALIPFVDTCKCRAEQENKVGNLRKAFLWLQVPTGELQLFVDIIQETIRILIFLEKVVIIALGPFEIVCCQSTIFRAQLAHLAQQ